MDWVPEGSGVCELYAGVGVLGLNCASKASFVRCSDVNSFNPRSFDRSRWRFDKNTRYKNVYICCYMFRYLCLYTFLSSRVGDIGERLRSLNYVVCVGNVVSIQEDPCIPALEKAVSYISVLRPAVRGQKFPEVNQTDTK